MKNIQHLFISFILLFGFTDFLVASQVDCTATQEQIGCRICHIRMHHQGLWRTLNVKIWYQLAETEEGFPDTFLVKQHVKQFLIDYPNTTDFWEIMNKKLVAYLANAFPMITTLEVELGVTPDEMFATHRRSLVRYTNGEIEELFGFKHDKQPIIQEYFNNSSLVVTYKLCHCVEAAEYPDYQWLSDAIDTYLSSEWDPTVDWETLKPKLMQYLREQFPMIICTDITLLNE